MGDYDLETEVAVLKQQVMDLSAQIAALGVPAGGGFLKAPAPGQIVAEPKPVTAFDVRMVDGAWKMYYPAGCLMCDGAAPTGITPDADGYVAVQEGNVGIGITWTKNKETKAVTNVVAKINQTMTSSLTVTEGADAYSISVNFPVALKLNNEIRQVTSGFVSLTSDTGDDGMGVDNVSIEEYDSDSDSNAEPVHAIKGWHDAEPSASNLGGLLSGESEDTTRQLLVRNGKGGATEFLPIGKVASAKNGKLSVKFGTDAAVQKFSANTDQDSTLEFAKVADTGSYNDLKDKPTIPQPIQPNDGKLKVQFGTDAATDKFSANQQSNSTLQFAKVASTGSYNDLTDKPKIPTPATGSVSYIVDIRYDVSSQQLQKRIDTLDLASGLVTQGTWTMITGGQAVEHIYPIIIS